MGISNFVENGQSPFTQIEWQKGIENWTGKMVTELEGKIEMNGQPIPARMNLNDQGLFILGYYHQTQKRYAKKEEK